MSMQGFLRADGRKGIRNAVVVVTWSSAPTTSPARSRCRSATGACT